MSPADGPAHAIDTTISTLKDRIMPILKEKIPADKARWAPRADVAREAKQTAADYLTQNRIELNLLDQRDLVTSLVNTFQAEHAAPAAAHPAAPAAPSDAPPSIPVRSVIPTAASTAAI